MRIIKSQINDIFFILIVLFFVTCTSKRSADDGMMYPEKMNLNNGLINKLENCDYDYFNNINLEALNLYCLGDYYLFQSTLCGPTGRGSNFYYYLLVDKSFYREFFFASISNEIKNIWISEDTLYINIWDYDDETYFNDDDQLGDSGDFVFIQSRFCSNSFTLYTITYEKKRLRWKDIK